CHADVEWIVPFDMLLAPERMHNGSFQAFCQFDDFIMRARAPRSAQHCDSIIAVEKRSEARELLLRWCCDRSIEQQGLGFWHRLVRGWLQCHVPRDCNNRNPPIADGLADGDFKGTRHLVRPGDKLTIMTALLE